MYQKKTPIQLTKELAEKADKIIVTTAKEDLPDYLQKSNKTVFWGDVPDARDKSYEFHIKIRDSIEPKVKELVHEIE